MTQPLPDVGALLKALEAVSNSRGGWPDLDGRRAAIVANYEPRGVLRSGQAAQELLNLAAEFGLEWQATAETFVPTTPPTIVQEAQRLAEHNRAVAKAMREIADEFVYRGEARRSPFGGLAFKRLTELDVYEQRLTEMLLDHGYRRLDNSWILPRLKRWRHSLTIASIMIICLATVSASLQFSNTPEAATRISAIAAVASVLAATISIFVRRD